MPEKKWDFEFPETPPSITQRIRFGLQRAENNLKYGFDGSQTPLQLGPLKETANLPTASEVMLMEAVRDGGLLGLIKLAAMKSDVLLSSRKAIAQERTFEELKE